MKDQDFGDIRDYFEFGLLRLLVADSGLRTGVCWMRTAGEARADGKKIAYLSKPEKWRKHDPELFEFLREHVQRRKDPRIGLMEESGLLRHTKYFSEVLTDDREERQGYFERMQAEFEDRDVISFHPESGLEAAAVRCGKKDSSKYLYMAEVAEAYRSGMSVYVSQEFARENRNRLMAQAYERLREDTGARVVLSYQTTDVTYFLIPQRKHARHFQSQDREISAAWGDQVTIVKPHSSRTFNAPSFTRMPKSDFR